MLQPLFNKVTGVISNVFFQSSFFRKNLTLVLLTACLPTIVIGLSLYSVGVSQIEKEVNRSHQNQLNQLAVQIDEQLSRLEMSLSQWAYNPLFGEQLMKVDLGQELDLTRDIYKNLTIMTEMNPLVADVYLYVDTSSRLVSNKKGLFTIHDPAQKDRFHKLLEQDKDLYWTKDLYVSEIPSLTLPSFRHSFKYTLVHQLPGVLANKYGALIVQLDAQAVNRMFDVREGSNSSILVDSSGEPLIQHDNDNPLYRQLREGIMDRYLSKGSGAYPLVHEQTRYSVSYSTFSRLGIDWILATATDISSISRPVIVMSRWIISVSVLVVILAVGLSWIASRRMYRPIARLMGTVGHKDSSIGYHTGDELSFIERQWNTLSLESRILQNRVKEQLPTLRDGFMLQLVQGHLYYLSESELRERMSYYGWDIHGQRYIVMVIQLMGLTKEDGKFRESDEQLVTFAAANIVNELVQMRLGQAHVINFHDLSIGILSTMPDSLSGLEAKKELISVSNKISSTLSHILKLDATICIGQPILEMKQIPDITEATRRTLQYRKLGESNQVIDMDTLVANGSYKFHYPFEAEKSLIHAIRMGQEEEALSSLDLFIQEVERHVEVELYVQQAMYQLLGSVHHSLLSAGFPIFALHEGENLYAELSELRLTMDMRRWFKVKIIAPYVLEINTFYDTQLKQSVQQVIRLIGQNYMKDLSLEDYCDQVGVTSISTMSRAFKETTGTNYVDYLTQFRVERSKELLMRTDMKIVEVAESVGYQHSYYNRVFKRYEGVTPSQYRIDHKSK
ncbi:helix-turn-helix domain-containing protein [Paenibacillus sp. GCM10023252]